MVDKRKPRHGSMAHRPRKRASNQNARTQWQPVGEKRLLGFAGYKAGMMHVSHIDQTESPSKGQEVVSAVTVVEVPPMVVYGIRCYDGVNSIGDMLTHDEKILKATGIKTKKKSGIKEESVRDARLLVFAQPEKTGFGKKHIERMELGFGGKDAKEKLEYAKSMLGKELKISEVFKPGEFVDIIAVTKGKGWQGTVKRFGVSIQRRKATGKRRHVGTLGPFHPPYIAYTVPRAGQMGYHKRTEFSKEILKIGSNADEINPSSGFTSYGFVKNDYVLIRGSVPGPVKRMLKLRLAVRKRGEAKTPQLIYVPGRSR
ncbi:50S ribosomal protein L3 [Candidatus Micrarchaeota archaeon]|nr:50S ribosomal protein L3 [Candidatus Micrarchaeota archaeon]